MAFAGSTSHPHGETGGRRGERDVPLRGSSGRAGTAAHGELADAPSRAGARRAGAAATRQQEIQVARTRTGARSRADTGASLDERSTVTSARGRPYAQDVDWRRWGSIGTGVAIGALLGAGVALLLAPQDGEATRQTIRRAGRRATSRAADVWSDLGDDLWFAGSRARRKLRRGVTRRRWDAEDWIEGVGRRGRRAAGRVGGRVARRSMAD